MLQNDVVTTTTWWLESPAGVAREIFAIEWDAVDQQDVENSSDKADEAALIELVAREKQDDDESSDDE
jgi:hypothetical protein